MPPFEVVPSARRLIRSLRDLGYDFVQAVADIVDNSISAQATRVDVDVVFDGDDSWVRISDNGRGMNPEQLREAMRYGSKREYEDDDLGKFGLGLKTASMSQCQRLVVASRWNPDRADISAYAWDLDHITETDRWEILPVDRSTMPQGMRGLLQNQTGTVVFWQRLDRILGFKHPYGESARKYLSKMCRDLELHLSMVFHAFIAGEARTKSLSLTINGNPVLAWDPFCRHESKSIPYAPVKLAVAHEGHVGQVVFEPFVLPHQSDFSNQDEFRRASGPANWNQQQGFYIYRAGRLIQSGGWSNLRAPDEHTKLARIAVRFPPELDPAFGINVAKMRVQLPAVIRDDVRKLIQPVTKLARQVYDRKDGNSKAQTTGSRAGSDERSPSRSNGDRQSEETAERLTFQQWSTRLLGVASPEEAPIIRRALRRLSSPE